MNKLRIFIFIVLCYTAVHTTAQTARPGTKETIVEFITTEGNFSIKLYNQTPKHRDNFIKLVKSGYYNQQIFHRAYVEYIAELGDSLTRHAREDTTSYGLTPSNTGIPHEFHPDLVHKKGAVAMTKWYDDDTFSDPFQFYIVIGRKFTNKEIINMANNLNKENKMRILNSYLESDSVKAYLNMLAMSGNATIVEDFMANKLRPIVDSIFEPMFFEPSIKYISTYMIDGGLPHLDRVNTVFGQVISGLDIIENLTLAPRYPNYRPVKNVRVLRARIVE
jgi:peptidyl-prolyl cis-trans isomerase B (cyclophilin B)